MRRIIFENYRDKCAYLVLLKKEIKSLNEEIENLEKTIFSMTSVVMESLFKPLNNDVQIDYNSLNMLYIKFINLYYDCRRIYGETALDDDINIIQTDDEKLHKLKKELDSKKLLYKSKRKEIIEDIYKKFYGDLGIQNSEGYILAAQLTDEMIKYLGMPINEKVKKLEKK